MKLVMRVPFACVRVFGSFIYVRVLCLWLRVTFVLTASAITEASVYLSICSSTKMSVCLFSSICVSY